MDGMKKLEHSRKLCAVFLVHYHLGKGESPDVYQPSWIIADPFVDEGVVDTKDLEFELVCLYLGYLGIQGRTLKHNLIFGGCYSWRSAHQANCITAHSTSFPSSLSSLE
jgi:hypothetical protein